MTKKRVGKRERENEMRVGKKEYLKRWIRARSVEQV